MSKLLCEPASERGREREHGIVTVSVGMVSKNNSYNYILNYYFKHLN